MNRLKFAIIVVLATAASLLQSSCVQGDGVTGKDFRIVSGISNEKLMLDGREGVSSTFSFTSNYDWSIIDYSGFTCDPTSGHATLGNEVIRVEAKPLSTNNTGDTIRLSDLNFKLKKTRFVGISAHQLPQIIAKNRKVNIESIEGSKSSVTFKSKCNIEDIELVRSSDKFEAKITGKKDNGGFTEYTITITANERNLLIDDLNIGHIEFKVNGVVQERLKIEVIQLAAISFDRSCVLLPGRKGGENSFSVNSKYDIEISYNSSSFAVTPDGDKRYVVTALVDNNSDKQVLLGEIEIKLKDTPDTCNSIEVYQQKAKASQTLMFYFIGTSLRYPYYTTNIDNMLEALSRNIQYDARVIVTLTDKTDAATMYELRYDSVYGKAVKEEVKSISLSTPYTSNTFEDVIRNMKKFAPAEKYSLIIGSHGHGWTSKYFVETQSAKLKKMGYTIPLQLWQKPEGALTRHLGDGTAPGEYSKMYDVEEIATAIAANDIKLEYILFDACFMGNIESAYALRNITKYIVGSPCEIMGSGFPYSKVAKYMFTDNGKSYDLNNICKEFVDHYKTDDSVVGIRSACVAITHTAELEALAAAMKSVNNAAVKEEFSLDNVQYYDGLSSSSNPVHIFYDLGDFVEQSCADSNAAAAFKTQLAKSVTSLYHTDKFYSAYDATMHDINSYSGTTTSAMILFCADEWKKTEWYKATH